MYIASIEHDYAPIADALVVILNGGACYKAKMCSRAITFVDALVNTEDCQVYSTCCVIS